MKWIESYDLDRKSETSTFRSRYNIASYFFNLLIYIHYWHWVDIPTEQALCVQRVGGR